MRAILNFLAMMLTTLSSHLGGDIQAQPAVVPAPQVVVAANPEPPSLLPNLNGALAALPIANTLMTQVPIRPEPIVVVRYVDASPKHATVAAPGRHELPTSDVFAMVPKVERAKLKAAMESAKANIQNMKLEFGTEVEDVAID